MTDTVISLFSDGRHSMFWDDYCNRKDLQLRILKDGANAGDYIGAILIKRYFPYPSRFRWVEEEPQIIVDNLWEDI